MVKLDTGCPISYWIVNGSKLRFSGLGKGFDQCPGNHKNSSLWCKAVNNFEKWKASGNQHQIKYKITGAIYEQDSNVVSF